MKTLARITGVTLMALGLLTIVGALILGILGGAREALRVAQSFPVGRGPGLTGLLELLFVIGHGLLLAGVGEGLWLLANIGSAPRSA